MIRAIVPAAGEGTRLRPHTHTAPKPLLPVAGRPIIDHVLCSLVGAGVEEAVVVVGYMGGHVEEYVRDRYPFAVRCAEQEVMEGLGAAVERGLSVLDGDDPVLVVLGDTIVTGDFGGLTKRDTNSLGVVTVRDPRRFGVVELDGGRVTRLVEKPDNPKSDLALAGVYFVRDVGALRRACGIVRRDGILTRGEYQLTDALQIMIDEGCGFDTFEIEGWYDCGTQASLLATNRALLDQGISVPESSGSKDVVIVPPVAVDASAVLERCVVGPHVTISADAAVSDSVVVDSIVMEGASVSWSVLDGAIIGTRASIRGRGESLDLGDRSVVDRTNTRKGA
jgi:glucose-1-phosphate thymidylyltransferase